jgi:hypothetical protein
MRGVSPLLHPRLARVFCRCFPGRRLESTASSSSGDLRVPFAIVGQRVGLRVLFIPVLAIFGLHVGFIDVMSRAAAAFPARGSIASFTRVLPPSVLTFSSRVPAELCGGSTDCSESGPWARVWMVSALFAKPEHRTCYPPTCLRVARERFRAYVAICHRCAKGARPLCALFTAAGGSPQSIRVARRPTCIICQEQEMRLGQGSWERSHVILGVSPTEMFNAHQSGGRANSCTANSCTAIHTGRSTPVLRDSLICLQTSTRRSMVNILRQQLSCNIPGRVHFRLYIIRHKFTTFNSNFHPSPILLPITFFDIPTLHHLLRHAYSIIHRHP